MNTNQTTEITTVIDYAYPTLMAEKALRNLHEAALANNYADAREWAAEAVVRIMDAHAALLVMEDRGRR